MKLGRLWYSLKVSQEVERNGVSPGDWIKSTGGKLEEETARLLGGFTEVFEDVPAHRAIRRASKHYVKPIPGESITVSLRKIMKHRTVT